MKLQIAVWISLIAMTAAFPTGPPVVQYPEICGTMTPFGHNVSKQNDPAPFEFAIEGNCYKANMDVPVRIRVKTGMETYFEGLFVQARVAGNDANSFGMFNVGSDSTLQTLDCFSGSTANAFGQKSKAHYTCKSFVWKAPSNVVSTIKFRATMVHETDKYWEGVMSSELTYNASCATPTAVQCPPDNTGGGMRPFMDPCVILGLTFLAILTHFIRL